MARVPHVLHLHLALLLAGLINHSIHAFNLHSDSNLVNYWGQNSYGAAGGDPRLWQKPLAEYCQTSDAENVIVLAFLNVFNSASRGLPGMDLSNQCDPGSIFPGTSLIHCPATGAGVKQCQSKGKAVLLSLGGAAGAYGFSNDAEARDFAHMIWNLFLGGSSATRPLDDAVLDGVDLDIEGGSSIGYPVFIAELRLLFATDPQKQYYVSAAPQCPFPDVYLGTTLQEAWVDMVFVQFYNNYCGTQAYGSSSFNFEQWDNWAKTAAINKDVKIYLGVPASRTAANAGYITPEKLDEIVDVLRCKFSSFGGVMMWDTSQAYSNTDASGLEYGLAAAQNLQDPRNLVCGGPKLEPIPLNPVNSAPLPVPSSNEPASAITPPIAGPCATTSTTSSTREPAVSMEPVPEHLSASSTSVPAQALPTPPLPSPETVQTPSGSWPRRDESRCPTQGGKCRLPSSPSSSNLVCDGYDFGVCVNGHWVLRACAPGTYCTSAGCDFIKEPVKSCRQLEREAHKAKTMRKQMGDVVDRMWSAFGNIVDSTWADYLGRDIDASQNEPLPARSRSGHPQYDSQHEIVVPGSVDNINNEAQHSLSKPLKPFLIDFVQLDASREVGSFEHTLDAQNAIPFRMQVRIRTNGEAISPLWEVAFNVKPGQIVTSTSRGTFRQQGLKVFVASNPDAEAGLSMVVRFVIEGVETAVPVRDPEVSKDPQPDDSQGSFEAADPTSARFETKYLFSA